MYGPCFGYEPGKKDFYIATDSDKNKDSYSYFGHLYNHPDYQHGTDKAKSILAGPSKLWTLKHFQK
jgi:hypothetical protein